MTLKAQLASDLDVFYDTDAFAESITYNGEAVTAIVSYQAPENLPESVATEALIRVRVSVVALPAYRDPVVIGADTFYVFQDDSVKPVKTDDGLEWIIPLYRDERPWA